MKTSKELTNELITELYTNDNICTECYDEIVKVLESKQRDD